MPNIKIDEFNECLSKYLEHCKSSTWVDDEIYKFKFANWLNKKLNLKLQTVDKILAICFQSQKEKYGENTGVQFMIQGAKSQLSKYITKKDAEIFKYLSENENYNKESFSGCGVSYPILSAWLGTIFPNRFVCVASTDFIKSINFLFEYEKIPEKGFDFFETSQQYFKVIKLELKKHDLGHLFLSKINNYLLELYPKTPPKKKYDEFDWNWLTEDFSLYIFREYLKLYIPKERKLFKSDIVNENDFNELKSGVLTNEQIFDGDTEELDSGKYNVQEFNYEEINEFKIPEELPETDSELYTEGLKKSIIVNSYERNPIARKKCIEHWGLNCSVCNFNFYDYYGELGAEYIHVHHLTKISSIGQSYQINPVTDLRPVCPNCHSMLHRGNKERTIEELKEILNK